MMKKKSKLCQINIQYMAKKKKEFVSEVMKKNYITPKTKK